MSFGDALAYSPSQEEASEFTESFALWELHVGLRANCYSVVRITCSDVLDTSFPCYHVAIGYNVKHPFFPWSDLEVFDFVLGGDFWREEGCLFWCSCYAFRYFCSSFFSLQDPPAIYPQRLIIYLLTCISRSSFPRCSFPGHHQRSCLETQPRCKNVFQPGCYSTWYRWT